MITQTEEWELTKPQPLYRQLVSRIEEQIYNGKLRPGDRLPNTDELSRRTSLAKNTVQQALTVLVERGIVERTTGRGTYVSQGIACRTIAIVSGWNFLHHDSARFLQLFADEVRIDAAEKGWAVKYYLPERKTQCGKMLSELERDISAGAIRGVIYVSGNEEAHQWFTTQCEVPWISPPSRSPDLDTVTSDSAYRGMAYLLERGYRKVAMVSHQDNEDFLMTCVGKAIDDVGVNAASVKHFFSLDVSETAGYQLVTDRILKEFKGCDAFLVLNDILCKGVLFGLMQMGKAIPGDVGVFTHSNAGVEMLCPVPLTRTEEDASIHASCALENLFGLLNGTSSSQHVPLPQLIVGESCGEVAR